MPLGRQPLPQGPAGAFASAGVVVELLERKDRAGWHRPDAAIAALHLAGTETVSDVGAGSGHFTFRFARALPKGKVVAIDVDPEMVRHVHHTVLTEGLPNVEAVLSTPDDPSESAKADVVFICDLVHHVTERPAWLRKLFLEMRPGARLVVIELKEGKLPEGPPEAVKIPRATLTSPLRDAGFVLKADDPRLLPYQTFLVFERPTRAAAASR